MKRDILSMLTDDWRDVKEVIVYGYGIVASRYIDKLNQDFRISFIIDNNSEKFGTYHKQIPIFSYEQIRDKINGKKIIILAAVKTYQEIKEQLEEEGLLENNDFCSIEQFVTEWYWKYRQKSFLLEVHIAVTTKCSLNCKNCNMFMPFYKTDTIYTKEEIAKDIDLLFQRADYLFNLAILGGEPFLNPNLGEILDFIWRKYRNKVGRVGIITNGTIIPNISLLSKIKEYHVELSISDYNVGVNYRKRLDSLKNILDREKISYCIYPALEWCDFGFPIVPNEFNGADAIKHMKFCAPLFHGLNDKKFYYCHVSWSAEKCGLFQLEEGAYIDLEKSSGDINYDKKEMLLHSRGVIDKGYLELCKVCGGCGQDNENFVQAGVQLR